MAISRVNVGIIRNWGGAGTATLTTAATSLTAGNTLIVAIGAQDIAADSAAVPAVIDTAGNTYTKVDYAYQSTDFRVELWYAKNVTGHASNQVTITFTGNVQYRGAVATQYAGLDLTAPLDTSAKNTQASGSGITTGTLTTTVANEAHILVARFGVTPTYPAGFSDLGGDLPYLQVQEKIVSATMSGTYSASGGSFQTVILVGAFKAAAAAPRQLESRVSQNAVELLADPRPSVRLTQAVIELLSLETVPARNTQDVIELLSENKQVFENAPLQIGLTYMKLTTRSGAIYAWSDRPLPDPAWYEGGWKAPRVTEWGRIRRALS